MKEQSVTVYGNQIGLPMLIHVSRVRSHIASRVTWHAHDGFELLFLVDGATAYEFAGRGTVALRGGHFLVVPPGLVHRGLQDVRSPSTFCGLALKASRPAAWNNTTFTATEVRGVRTSLEKASQKVSIPTPELPGMIRSLPVSSSASALAKAYVLT